MTARADAAVGTVKSREERWQDRLALPVLVAALASIPAMFLTVAEGALGTAGHVVDAVSGLVLVAETLILLAVAENKRAWLRGHLGLIALTVAVVVAIVFALGPVQVLRLVRTVGALRILRAGRIVKAARAVGVRHGFTGWLAQALAVGAGLLVAVFVGVVLADPTSRSRDLLTAVLGDIGTPVIVALSAVAGVVLGAATYLLARDTGSDGDTDDARRA
jgi:CsoR family transcriptional regulator, copper-sensing transcriptional repressor